MGSKLCEKFKYTYDYIDPPGYYHDFIEGLGGKGCIKASIFDNHRFLLYSLIVENHDQDTCPTTLAGLPLTLISFDYHRDLVEPGGNEKDDLRRLNVLDRKEVAFYVWNHMSHLNDSQILSAQYLNLISDAYILCKDDRSAIDRFEDKDGQSHCINMYTCYKSFIKAVGAIRGPIVLDIDLDFFTYYKRDAKGHDQIQCNFSEKELSIFNENSEFFSLIKNEIKQITIAREPSHCGGVENSNKLCNEVCSRIFDGPIFSRGPNRTVRLKASLPK